LAGLYTIFRIGCRRIANPKAIVLVRPSGRQAVTAVRAGLRLGLLSLSHHEWGQPREASSHHVGHGGVFSNGLEEKCDTRHDYA